MAEALRLAADLVEENDRLQVSRNALERISDADGAMCVRDAAKTLQMRPKDLTTWLNDQRWIYKQGSKWAGYQARIEQGVLHHKVTSIPRDNDEDRLVQQVMVTPKGLSKIARSLSHG